MAKGESFLTKWERVIKQEPAMARDPYNDGYTHEAMHAAHICCDTWDAHVADTRCAEEYPDVREAIEKAAQAMYNVYQLIGQKMHDSETAQPTPAVME